MALRLLVHEKKKAFIAGFRICGNSSAPDDSVDATSAVYGIARTAQSNELAALTVLLTHVAGEADFIEAESLLDPIFERIAEYDAAFAARESERGRLASQHHEALERARAEALASAENSPEVIAAREALEKAI